MDEDPMDTTVADDETTLSHLSPRSSVPPPPRGPTGGSTSKPSPFSTFEAQGKYISCKPAANGIVVASLLERSRSGNNNGKLEIVNDLFEIIW